MPCEDTRQTQKLLNHFEISKPTVSCHEHNEHERAAELIKELVAGARIALVSDAGTPGVSDPGVWLAREAIAAGVSVFPIPGANAAISALIASGLPSAEFQFLGFLPEKSGARRTCLEKLASQTDSRGTARTLIFYEAPHRILDTLADFESVFGARSCELSSPASSPKISMNSCAAASPRCRQQLAGRDRIRGEITLLIEAPAVSAHSGGAQRSATALEKIADRVAYIQAESAVDEKEALKRLARELGRSKSDLYRELQRERAGRRQL